MTDLAIAVAALILLGTGMVLVVGYLNRHLRRIEKSAAEVVRRRLSQRERLPLENLLDRAGIPGSMRPRATRLAEGLARATGVSAEYIRPEDRLRDLVVVGKDELDADDRKVWEDANLDERFGDGLYVFSEDVFSVLMKAYKRPEWKVLWAHVPKASRPGREREWLALIIDMTVKDLIEVFEKGG